MADDRHDTAEWTLEHWAGTLDQLVAAASLTATKIAALRPFPEGYAPESQGSFDAAKYELWDNTQKARKLSIAVQEKEGFTGRPRDLDELASLGGGTLRHVRNITITVGAWGQVLSVSIRCGEDRFAALSVVIEGFDRTWTAGIKHELVRILNPQRPLHAPLLGDRTTVAALGLLVFNLGWIGLDQLFRAFGAWDERTRVIVAVLGGILAAGLVVLAGLASSRFELLMSGQQARYGRWRGRLRGAAAAVIFGVIGSANLGNDQRVLAGPMKPAGCRPATW